QVLTLAAARGRQVALLGRSMEKNVAIASDLGYLGVPSGLLRPLEEVVALPAERQVILSTGSQGEPNSALAIMAAGEHKYVQIARGDLVVISARVIPGNERTVRRVINALYRLGAEVLYEDNAFVHVSGHASQEDLKLMLKLTQPRYFVPVHGEYRHLLGHARLAAGMGFGPDRVLLVEDGTALEVTPTTARLIRGYPTGRVLVDGTGIGDIGAVVLRDRQILSEDGVIAVALTFDKSGAVVAGPEIASRGVVYVKENEVLLEEMRAAVRAALAARDPAEPWDRDAVAARVRPAVGLLPFVRLCGVPVPAGRRRVGRLRVRAPAGGARLDAARRVASPPACGDGPAAAGDRRVRRRARHPRRHRAGRRLHRLGGRGRTARDDRQRRRLAAAADRRARRRAPRHPDLVRRGHAAGERAPGASQEAPGGRAAGPGGEGRCGDADHRRGLDGGGGADAAHDRGARASQQHADG